MSWKVLNGGPLVEFKTFRNGKVGHVVQFDGGLNFKAFYDGIFLGSHKVPEDARLAIELLSGDHADAPAPWKPPPTYRGSTGRLNDSDHH